MFSLFSKETVLYAPVNGKIIRIEDVPDQVFASKMMGEGVGFVNDGNEIMLITNQGIIIRIKVDDISVLGRVTSGVKLMNTGEQEDIIVASITKVKESVTLADEEARRLEELQEDNESDEIESEGIDEETQE